MFLDSNLFGGKLLSEMCNFRRQLSHKEVND